MLKKLLLLSAVLSGAITMLSGAEPGRVIEIRKKAELNPSLYFSGIPGQPELTTAIRSFFAVCGWFELTGKADEADYTITASAEAGSVVIRLTQRRTPVAAWRFSNRGNSRALAKNVVDTVIERTFEQLKVRGFCNSRIAFCAKTAPGIRNIFVCDIDGDSVEQITKYRTLNVEPCWSPDGNTIFFSKYNRSGIDIVETTVNRQPRFSRIISSFRGINTGAAISPDGNTLAAILSPDHQVDLYCLGLKKKFRRRLTKGIAVEASPCWSPDGSQIAFVSDRSGNPRIYIASASGRGEPKRIPTIGRDAVTPAWSKDGKIAYATRIDGSYVLAVYDLKSGENRRITTGDGNWESPGWAADNRQVVCKRTSGGHSALYVVDTKTGRERLLLKTGSRLFDPAWSPCRDK